MKKKFLISLLTITISLCSGLLVSCGDLPTYSVYFLTDDTVYWQTITFGNEQILLPDEPVKEGYNFGGWYLDIGTFEQEFTADYLKDIELTSDLVVFAKFTSSHVHTFITTTINPTCTAEGYTSYECTCGESYIGNIVPALGHTEDTLSAVSPTCTSGGLTEGKICSVCGEIILSQDYLPVLGHDFGEFTSNNDATLEADGTKTAVCQKEGCNQTLTVTDEGTKLTPTDLTLTYMVAGEVYLVDVLGEGDALEIPTPEIDGRVFDGWFLDNGEWQNPFTPLYLEVEGLLNEITIYAKFSAVHEHDYQSAPVDADCLNAGYTAHYCACGFYYFDEFTEALGHDEIIDEEIEATCSAPGKTQGKHCARCENILVEQLEVTVPHTSELIPEILATCTEDGYTYGYKCSVCQEILTEPQLVEATGHNFTESATLPSCDSMGSTVKVCACGHSETTALDALGHLFTTYVSNGDATNYKDGTKTAVCDREGCSATQVITDVGSMLSPIPGVNITIRFFADGEEISSVQTPNDRTITLPAKPAKEGKVFDGWYLDDGVYSEPFLFNYLLENQISTDLSVYAKFTANHEHSFSDVVTAPTCTDQGFTTHACVCSDSFVDTFTEALGHDEVILPYLAPTCTEIGKTQGKTCNVCGQVLVAQTDIEAKGHVQVVIDGVLPTCTASGYTQGVNCSTCGDTLIERQVIEATGHSHAVTSITEPTCIDDGHTVYTCACGDYYTTVENALGHEFTTYLSNNDATYTADGTKTAVCNRECCLVTDTITDEGTMLVHYHSYNAVVYESTCYKQGYTKHTCSCGDFYIDAYTPVLNHIFTTYISNGNGTMTATCDRRGCNATDVKIDEVPTVIATMGYLEDFGYEIITNSVKEFSVNSQGNSVASYYPKKTEIAPRIFLSFVQMPTGVYTATFNGESIGDITVTEKREADLGYLPSNLTFGVNYTLVCVSKTGKIYEQTIKYVSRAIDSGEELLRAVSYYNKYSLTIPGSQGRYEHNLTSPNPAWMTAYNNSTQYNTVSAGKQYYNGSSFSQRYYVLACDVTVNSDLCCYGVGGTYDVRNMHCDLWRQDDSYWFDYIDGQGHTISIERFVDGGVFGHISQYATVKNLCINPISTYWNQIAVETKVVLGMSISNNATVENIAILIDLEVTLGGINTLGTQIYSGAHLKNIYIHIPKSVTFAQNDNTATFMLETGYLGRNFNATDAQNIVVLSPNFKHASIKSGQFVGANNQDYDNYIEGCYYFDDVDFLLNSGRGAVGAWFVMSDGSAKFFAQHAN